MQSDQADETAMTSIPRATEAMRPTQAVILAGGRGTRLLPLTATRPKPMVEFHGRPFLEYLIEQLREQGFTRVLLLLGYLPDVIRDHFGDGSRFGVSIEYSVTDVDDETGARLRAAKDRIDPVFLFLYCDNYVPFSFADMWAVWQRERPSALVTVYANDDGYTRSNLIVGGDGRIAVYDKTRKHPGLKGVDIGYMLASKQILELLPAGNVSFESTVYPQLVAERTLHAFVTRHRYYSVGDHRRLPLTEQFLQRRPTVLLDRDGVLNEKMPRADYVRSWKDWTWRPNALDALRLLTEHGVRLIVITNQAGIARKVMTEADLETIHTHMLADVQAAGSRIEAIYYCPHGWDEGCDCRKPAPGMFYAAQRDFQLDLSRCLYIGDDERDMQAAQAASCPFRYVTPDTSLFDIARYLTADMPEKKRNSIIGQSESADHGAVKCVSC
jgi:D-glycero-D-manno-heptose 1,7-bisphosphate phosphatase